MGPFNKNFCTIQYAFQSISYEFWPKTNWQETWFFTKISLWYTSNWTDHRCDIEPVICYPKKIAQQIFFLKIFKFASRFHQEFKFCQNMMLQETDSRASEVCHLWWIFTVWHYSISSEGIASFCDIYNLWGVSFVVSFIYYSWLI